MQCKFSVGMNLCCCNNNVHISMFSLCVSACKILLTEWRLVEAEDVRVTLHTIIKPGPLIAFEEQN